MCKARVMRHPLPAASRVPPAGAGFSHGNNPARSVPVPPRNCHAQTRLAGWLVHRATTARGSQPGEPTAPTAPASAILEAKGSPVTPVPRLLNFSDVREAELCRAVLAVVGMDRPDLV